MIGIGKLSKEDLLCANNRCTCNGFNATKLGKPKHGVNHVVQTNRATQTHKEAIQKRTNGACLRNIATGSNKQLLERRPNKEENASNEHTSNGSYDRHKTRTTKKAKYLRQLDVVIPIVQVNGNKSDNNCSNNAGVDSCAFFHEQLNHSIDSCFHNQVTGNTCKCSGTFIAFGKANTQTHAQKHGKVTKDNATSSAHYLKNCLQGGVCKDGIRCNGCCIRKRTTNTKQQTCGGQNCNRKHKRFTYFLQRFEHTYSFQRVIQHTHTTLTQHASTRAHMHL